VSSSSRDFTLWPSVTITVDERFAGSSVRSLRGVAGRSSGPSRRSPRQNGWFVAAGASARPGTLGRLGGLYWFAHLDLAMRLRGERQHYRRLAVGPGQSLARRDGPHRETPLLLSPSYEPGLIRPLSAAASHPGTCSSTSARISGCSRFWPRVEIAYPAPPSCAERPFAARLQEAPAALVETARDTEVSSSSLKAVAGAGTGSCRIFPGGIVQIQDRGGGPADFNRDQRRWLPKSRRSGRSTAWSRACDEAGDHTAFVSFDVNLDGRDPRPEIGTRAAIRRASCTSTGMEVKSLRVAALVVVRIQRRYFLLNRRP